MNNQNVKDYVSSLLSKNMRLDGRKLTDLRKPVKIELGISKNAEGSAKAIIGNTEVIAGVKMSVGEPYADSPDKGVLIVGAELLPLSSPEFTLGPPGKEAVELARIVDRGIRESGAIDVEKLCIRKGELVWIVFLDIYTLNDDGNLIDAAALAAMAALKSAVLPKLEDDKVIFGEFTKDKLPMKKTPITCTLFKIGEHIFVDAQTKEESVVEARVSIAVSENDEINAMQKGGNVGISIEELETMVKLAIEKTKELRKLLP